MHIYNPMWYLGSDLLLFLDEKEFNKTNRLTDTCSRKVVTREEGERRLKRVAGNSLFVFLGTGEGTVCAFMCLYFLLRRKVSTGPTFTQTQTAMWHVSPCLLPS